MPKATWGDFSSEDIDNVEQREGFTPYSGPLPRNGLYRFTIKTMKQGTSQTGNPKMLIVSELDGSWKPEHAKFDGCPIFDHMPVTKSTAFRVRAFCDAVGLTSKEWNSRIILDENGKVTKLGSLGDPAGLQVYINIARRPAEGEYDESIGLAGTGYLPIDEDDEDEDEEVLEDPEEDDEDEDEPPF